MRKAAAEGAPLYCLSRFTPVMSFAISPRCPKQGQQSLPSSRQQQKKPLFPASLASCLVRHFTASPHCPTQAQQSLPLIRQQKQLLFTASLASCLECHLLIQTTVLNRRNNLCHWQGSSRRSCMGQAAAQRCVVAGGELQRCCLGVCWGQ